MYEDRGVTSSKRVAVIYAMGRLGSSVLLSLIDLATFWLYLEFFEIGGIMTGIAFAAGKLVIAFSGWYFGYLSDVTKSERWGRRRPYMLAGSILLAVSTTMIFVPNYFISTEDLEGLFFYLVFFFSLANFSYGLLSTPYMAWLAEIANPEERVAVSAYQNTFAILAQIIGVLLSFSLPILVRSPLLLLSLLAGLAVFEIALYAPALIKIKEEWRPIPKPNVSREISMLLSNRNYRYWLALQGLMSMPTAILASLILSYVQKVLMLSDVESLMAGGILLLATVVLFFIWTAVSRRVGKKRPLVISLIVLTASLPLTLIIGQQILYFIPGIIQATSFILLVAVGISGWYLFPNPVTADIAHEDEITRGEARAGSYYGLISVPLNVLQAIARFVAGFIADLPLVEGRNYSFGLLLWGPVSSVFLIPCLFLLIKYVETDPLRRMVK